MNNFNKILKNILTRHRKLIFAGIACLVVWYGISAITYKSSRDIMAPEARSVDNMKTDEGGKPPNEDDILSLRDVAVRTGIPADEIVSVLQNKSYKVSGADDSLEQIANDNRTSTARLLNVIDAYKKNHVNSQHRKVGRFAGKTLEEICDENDISLNDVLDELESKGDKVDPKDNLKQIADKLGLSLDQILSIIENRRG